MRTSRTIVSIVLAFLVPGAGHLFLGRWARAIAYCIIVVVLFGIGLSIDGRLDTAQGGLLNLLCTFAAMGNGLLYIFAHAHENVRSATFEYGTNFIRTAGLMNLLLVLDSFDIAQGRKE